MVTTRCESIFKRLPSHLLLSASQTDFDGQSTVSNPRSIEFGESDESKINVYPNPAGNYIVVVGVNPAMEHIGIYDVLGREVTRQAAILEKSDNSVRFDLSKLASGIYYVKTAHSGIKVYKE